MLDSPQTGGILSGCPQYTHLVSRNHLFVSELYPFLVRRYRTTKHSNIRFTAIRESSLIFTTTRNNVASAISKGKQDIGILFISKRSHDTCQIVGWAITPNPVYKPVTEEITRNSLITDLTIIDRNIRNLKVSEQYRKHGQPK